MSTYAIGDIQGCAQTFAHLLKTIDFHPSRDRLWLTGDLVNRGPKSVETMQGIMALGNAVQTVLGNHDLHAMAIALGVASPRRGDTLDDLLAAPERDSIIAWLRQQPLLVRAGRWGLVHAGLLPAWTTAEAEHLAGAAELRLSGTEHCAKTFLAALQQPWDGKPVADASPDMQDVMVTKTLTYVRMCDAQGNPRLDYKGTPGEASPGLTPWYAVDGRKNADTTWACGHWAAQGLHLEDNVRALDTGCVWGHKLTALRLEDETIYAVDALEPATIRSD
jgi:bis(5'-nucleosyl)-tetraphosphatase (symmetrical)